MIPIKVKKLHPDATLPTYAHPGDAGADLYAVRDDVVLSHEILRVGCGFALEIPPGYEGQVRPRSSLALRGITVANAPGTLDPSYRGEVQVLLYNRGAEPFYVSKGDRVAQLVIVPVTRAAFQETEELEPSERGEGGFGSSGR